MVIAVRALTGSVRGFYLESQTADRDTDPNTSEGLLVFIGSTSPPACAVLGNLVQIEGTVSNFVPSTAPVGSLPLTELASPIELPGAVDQPVGQSARGGDHRCRQSAGGGRIRRAKPKVAGHARRRCPMRRWSARAWAFSPRPSAQAVPSGRVLCHRTGRDATAAQRRGDSGYAAALSGAAGTVPVWNGNPESLRVNITGLNPAGTPYEVAAGSTVTGLSGVMDYDTNDGQFQLFTDAAGAGTPAPLTPDAERDARTRALASDLTIGSFNMERFYNDTAEGNGAVTLTTAAYQGRLNKASLAIRNVMRMPDIIGLEEVEGQRNSAGSPAGPHVIGDIVAKVNADAVAAGQGNPNYTFCIGLTNDPGAITPAIIYKQGKVQITECAQYGLNTQYNEPGGGSNILNDRPPITIRGKCDGARDRIPRFPCGWW